MSNDPADSEPHADEGPPPDDPSQPEPVVDAQPEHRDKQASGRGGKQRPERRSDRESDRKSDRRDGGFGAEAALVRFRVPGQAAEFDAVGLELRRSDNVVVEADRGPGVGTVIRIPKTVHTKRPMRRILRIVNDDDTKIIERNRVREREAFHFCVECIKA
ncbi:MAG: hypothetical protein V3T05_08040, partial [Myxococcota bacterium]